MQQQQWYAPAAGDQLRPATAHGDPGLWQQPLPEQPYTWAPPPMQPAGWQPFAQPAHSPHGYAPVEVHHEQPAEVGWQNAQANLGVWYGQAQAPAPMPLPLPLAVSVPSDVSHIDPALWVAVKHGALAAFIIMVGSVTLTGSAPGLSALLYAMTCLFMLATIVVVDRQRFYDSAHESVLVHDQTAAFASLR